MPPHTNGRFARPPQHTSKAAAPKIPADQVPSHVAVVMDGNGRWATQRGLHRTEGHKMGEAVLIDITCGAIELGIKHLTVYAFSTENWKRSTEEVRFLMGFNREVVRRRRENLNDMGVRMRWVGSRPRMWRSVIKEFDIAEQMTVGNDVITINYCVNYGGRTEIVEAARELAQEAADGRLNAEPDQRGDVRQAPAPRRHPRRRPVHPDVGGAAGEQLPAVAGGLRRIRLPGQAVAGLRPPRSVGGVRGVREPQPPVRQVAMDFRCRPHRSCGRAVLDGVLPFEEEDDGALTVHHDHTFASLRVVTIAEGLDMVSLTQILAWDLPLDNEIRDKVAQLAHDTLLGTVSLAEQVAGGGIADVTLRYNFPAAGLTDEALRTLIVMVLSTGADVRRALTG